jgi:hypothetical protein
MTDCKFAVPILPIAQPRSALAQVELSGSLAARDAAASHAARRSAR